MEWPEGWDLKVIELKGVIAVGSEITIVVDDGTHDLDHIRIRVEEIQTDGLIKGQTDYYGDWFDFVMSEIGGSKWMSPRPPNTASEEEWTR